MITHLLRSIFGTVTVSVTGRTEQFIELVLKSDLKCWNIQSKKDGSLSFCMYRNSFIKLHPFVRKTHSKVHIIKKSGLPYSLRGYKRRYGLVIGAVLFAALFYISSLFIWHIEISGCENVTKQEIMTRLAEHGINVGSFKSELDIKNIENSFLYNYPKMSWISINLKGTTAYVEVREINERPKLIDSSEPCNIYASRDGVIASVHAYMGYSVVKAGDTVSAGDLIVSGNYTDKYGEEYKLHSYAKIMAYTTHSHTVTVPFDTFEQIKTGNYKNKYSLKLTRFVIPLYFKENILYNNYSITKSEKKFRISKDIVLPISLMKTTYTETVDSYYRKSTEVALADAYELLRDFEVDLVGIQILDKKYEETVDENGVTVRVILECYEDIGITGKID